MAALKMIGPNATSIEENTMRVLTQSKKLSLPVLALSLAASFSPAYAQTQSPVDQGADQVEQTDPASEVQTISDLLAASEELSMLAELVKRVGLEVDLAGEGPFTVLAPSNEAIGLIDAETMQTFADKPELLRELLLAHVISGSAIKAADVSDMSVWATANGTEIQFQVMEDGSVSVEGANVVKADIEADNGVVHIIDRVLMGAASQEEAEAGEEVGVGEGE
jgi:uncharacterized surface protein with fasciclin (FAS1) repeats